MRKRLYQIGKVTTIVAFSFGCGTFYARNSEHFQPFRISSAAAPVMPSPASPTNFIRIPPTDVVQSKISRASEIMQYGYPGFDNVRTFEDFVLSYDRRNRTAHWVVEHLTPEKMVYDPSVDRSKCVFKEDESMHPYFRALNKDYKGSGYDRGHLAAAGNHRKTQNSVDQTFLLSNMSPQVGKGFNRDKWNELERYVRARARKSENVYVCTGPLYLPRRESDGKMYVKYEVIGSNNVAVPTHFFKALLIEISKGKFELESYVLPNVAIPDETPLSNFFVPIDGIERAAGFLIFEKVPKHLIEKINGQKRGRFF
ncbi:hypothetical protein AB6A40_008857 [Gnathostoma spinigerum]|uniref:Endonuclease n=1 Tax=Gnathostoma spinigerum TaxID=75299 RepID=A0ABD6EQB8_9BILA